MDHTHARNASSFVFSNVYLFCFYGGGSWQELYKWWFVNRNRSRGGEQQRFKCNAVRKKQANAGGDGVKSAKNNEMILTIHPRKQNAHFSHTSVVVLISCWCRHCFSIVTEQNIPTLFGKPARFSHVKPFRCLWWCFFVTLERYIQLPLRPRLT